MTTETFKIQREDGSIFAVVDTYREEDGERFLKIQVVEDSDWLSVTDMQELAIRLATLTMKLHYQDTKA